MAYQIIPEKCSLCGNCIQVCMNTAIIDLLDSFQINPAWCQECGACAKMCYEEAIVYNEIEGKNDENYLEFQDYELSLISEVQLLINSIC